MKGFNCKECGKTFFAVVDDPEAIMACKTEIKKYQRKGYELQEVDVSEPEKWCMCEKE